MGHDKTVKSFSENLQKYLISIIITFRQVIYLFSFSVKAK